MKLNWLLVVIAVMCTNVFAGTTVYDATADWSDTQNPNEVWTYTGNGLSPLTTNQQNWGGFGIGNAWAASTFPNPGHVPMWFKGGLTSGVGMHGSEGFTNAWVGIIWKSPMSGTISIDGSILQLLTGADGVGGDHFVRNSNWRLRLNGTVLASGNVSGAAPFDALSSGAIVPLTNINVSNGDNIVLEFISPTSFATFNGIDLVITLTDDIGLEPTASFTFTPDDPVAGEAVTFDASSSTDPDGEIVSYEWDFDADGIADESGLASTWTFTTPGDYSVSLTVTDDSGLTDTISNRINVTEDCLSDDPLFFQSSVSFHTLPPNGGPALVGEFTPTNGCTVDEVATAFGFDHFNWVNIALKYPRSLITWGLSTPFVDPPKGGFPGGRFADNLPFYWDEGTDTRIVPGYHLMDNITSDKKKLGFYDKPENALLLPGERMSFVTMLAGIKSDGWEPLDTYMWSSNYTGRGGVITTRNIDLPPAEWDDSLGGIVDLQNVLVEDLAPEVQHLMFSNGADITPPEITFVDIDIKPGNKKNKINPRSKGKIWVAILSGTEFDSLQTDIPTVHFGPDGAEVKRHKVKDVNRDGVADLLLKFEIRRTGIVCGDNEATLTGETFSGQRFTRSDFVKTVGCKKKRSDEDGD